MTESLSTGASQSFVIVTTAQMQALHRLLFLLIRSYHQHLSHSPLVDRSEAAEMHELLRVFEAAALPAAPGLIEDKEDQDDSRGRSRSQLRALGSPREDRNEVIR